MAINLRMYISPNIIKVMKRLQMNIVLFGQSFFNQHFHHNANTLMCNFVDVLTI
ncbi:hypothetical protein MtrunA17_Chr7g0216401 [Medicago truncatula]|uniref:Uncharacterized protein n=1 Tax=Medicago truncatula TaxID=3880 RepID=A0A396GVD2_MEDTR|nr:hypothetical protein MtrunA17_Chr7g0216401 [Medicago truncatula]